MDVGADEEGALELKLSRGGFLVVVPESRMPPASLGELTIARKDGLPMLWEYDPESAECGIRAPLATGRVLGPLPAGDAAFVVRIGDEVVGETTATVRVGGYEPLRIPRIVPR